MAKVQFKLMFHPKYFFIFVKEDSIHKPRLNKKITIIVTKSNLIKFIIGFIGIYRTYKIIYKYYASIRTYRLTSNLINVTDMHKNANITENNLR